MPELYQSTRAESRMIPLWVAAIGLDTAAQLLFKAAAGRLGGGADRLAWLQGLVLSPVFWAGVLALAAMLPIWMLILRSAQLNLAFPATALTYIGVIAGSRWLFSEPIHWVQYCGIGLIVLGVSLLRATND